MSQTKRALVLYHLNCDDGFGAAWAFHTLKESEYHETFYCPVKYGEDFPDAWEGIADDVFIVDFSFPVEILRKEAHKYNSITQLDHHKSAYLDFEKAIKFVGSDLDSTLHISKHQEENISWQWDMDRSGAMMTWDYFSKKTTPTPSFISHIQDNDLWKFKFPDTKDFISALRSYPRNLKSWDEINKSFDNNPGAFNEFCNEGRIIQRYYNKQLQQNLNSTKRKIVIDGQEGLVANLPVQYASDAGNILAKESRTFGATHYTNSSGDTIFSLRSVGDYDVSLLAKKFGGGGHKNAAGFKLFSPMESSENGITIWSVIPETMRGPNE